MRFGIWSDSKSLHWRIQHVFAIIERMSRKKEEDRNSYVLSSYICPFSMLYKVQTDLFFLWSDPDAAWPYYIHYLDNDCSDSHRPCKCSKCAYRIFVQLSRVAKGKAIVSPWCEPHFCKDACHQSACKTTNAVYAPCVKCIIPFPPILERNCRVAGN